nr:hypothetical protein HK105_004877 [Polyrhizophydium stewartii]
MRLEIPSLKDGLQQAAMRNNWVDLVDFADKDALLRNACTLDSLDQVDYYLQSCRTVMEQLATAGNLTLAKQYFERYCYTDQLSIERLFEGDGIAATAANNGHVEFTVWALGLRPEKAANALRCAAMYGQSGITRTVYNRFLHYKRDKFRTQLILIIDTAAANGHLDIVQWLYGESNRCSVNGLFGAIHYKHQRVVDWLVANDRNLALFAPRS